MKKIITASLVAMMAVTAANAEIASVEYLEAKTGDITTLTTTAKSNLTAAVNELNTGVQAAATKTALEQGLATKQDTIGDLADIRSGAAAGATALQESIIAKKATSVSEDNIDKMVPTVDRMNNAIAEANTLVGDLATDLEDLEDVVAGKADKATTLAGYGITDAMTATQISGAITTATEGMATTGDVSTAKDAAIAAAAADATTKADAAEAAAIAAAGTAADGKIATALEDYSTTTEMNQAIATATTDMAKTGDVATAKSEAIAAAAADATTKADAAEAAAIAAAKEAADAAYDVKGAAAQALADAKADAAKYIDADELDASQTAQNTALQGYADGKVQDLQETLTSLATFPTACAQGTSDCALVIRSGTMQWEKVAY